MISFRRDVRAEIEGLVLELIPEEARNIDEMLAQFNGREGELVSSLRSMQLK